MKINSNIKYSYNNNIPNKIISQYQTNKKTNQPIFNNINKNNFIKNENKSYYNLTKYNLESFQIIQNKTFYKIQKIPSFEFINNLKNKKKYTIINTSKKNKRNNSYEPKIKSIKKTKIITKVKNLNEYKTNKKITKTKDLNEYKKNIKRTKTKDLNECKKNKYSKINYNKKRNNIRRISPDERNEKFYYINKTQPYKNKSENKNLKKKKKKKKLIKKKRNKSKDDIVLNRNDRDSILNKKNDDSILNKKNDDNILNKNNDDIINKKDDILNRNNDYIILNRNNDEIILNRDINNGNIIISKLLSLNQISQTQLITRSDIMKKKIEYNISDKQEIIRILERSGIREFIPIYYEIIPEKIMDNMFDQGEEGICYLVAGINAFNNIPSILD